MNRATAAPNVNVAAGQANNGSQSFQGGAGLDALYSYLQSQGFLSGAGNMFSTLGQNAALNTSTYQKNLTPLLQALGSLTGLPLGGAGNGGGNTQGGVNAAAPNQGAGADPYALTAPEATQLASQVDAVNQHYSTAINNLNQSLTARGIDPSSPEGQSALQYLQSQQQSAVSQTQANFMETNRQQKIQNASQALTAIMQIGGMGQSGAEAAASGTAGLGSAETSNTSTLGGTANADASSNISASIISDIGSVLGAWAGGGFGGIGGGSGTSSFGGGQLSNPSDPNDWNTV